MNVEMQKQSAVTDRNEPQTSPQAPQKNLTLIVVVSVFLTAGLVGTGVYFWQKTESEQKIASLEQRIASLEEDSDKTKTGVSSTPGPTASWKVYANDELNYQFKYPSNWFLSGSEKTLILTSYEAADTQVKDEDFWKGKIKIDIGAQEVSANTTLYSWIQDEYEEVEMMGGGTPTNIKHKKVSIGDFIGYKTTLTFDDSMYDFEGPQYHFLLANKFFFINVFGEYEKYEEVVNNILSTFEFTQDKESTAEWENYRSDEHDVKFQYPPDWKKTSATNKEWNDRLFLLTLNKKDSSQEVIAPGDNKVPANYWITFTVLSNPQELTAMEFYLDGVPLEHRSSMEKKTEKVSLGGLEGIKYPEGAAPSSGAQTVVTVARNKKLYKFSYGAMAQAETHEKFMSTFNSILSGFEFIE